MLSIGIFDSGFGGLNVLKGIVKTLPAYDYVYLGDSLRAPYGSRSREEIYEFSEQAVDFFASKNCGLIIFACNTASSDALRKIQKEYLPAKYPHLKVLGVLIPVAEEAVLQTQNRKIGVIATEATVASGSYARELWKLDPEIEIFQEACPELVLMIEEGKVESPEFLSILKTHLEPLLEKKIDTLILGCTHYGIIADIIRKNIPENIKIISSEEVLGGKLENYLLRHPEIDRELSRAGGRTFYSTDPGEKFAMLGSRFFGQELGDVNKATLS